MSDYHYPAPNQPIPVVPDRTHSEGGLGAVGWGSLLSISIMMLYVAYWAYFDLNSRDLRIRQMNLVRRADQSRRSVRRTRRYWGTDKTDEDEPAAEEDVAAAEKPSLSID